MTIPDPIVTFFKRLRPRVTFDPVRDWLTLLSLALIAFVSIVVWNIWAFDTVAAGRTIGAATVTESPVFNSASLAAIRTIFADRANEQAKYMTGIYRYADPSQ